MVLLSARHILVCGHEIGGPGLSRIPLSVQMLGSDHLYVIGLHAFLALNNVELDPLILLKGAET